MKKSRLVRGAGITVLTAAAATFGFSGTAMAEPADDVPIIIENLPAAAEALAASLQEAATAAAEHQSAEQASADVGEAVVEAGTILVTDTEQFGALGLGLALTNFAVQQGLSPYLGAVDDPSTAGDLINPDDFGTIADNAGPASDFVTGNATTALAEALKGNLGEASFLDPITGTPSAIGNTLAIGGDLQTGGALVLLTEGTNFQGLAAASAIAVIVGGAAAGGFAGDYVLQVEDGIAPVAEAGAPVTEPLIDALEGL